MSGDNGNGQQKLTPREVDFLLNEQARLSGKTSRGYSDRPLSATERETERLAMRDQIVALTKQMARMEKAIDLLVTVTAHDSTRITALHDTVNGLATFDREQDRRIDAIERGAAILSAWIKRPFWERVRARLGL